jgi:hypothetical protein
MIYSSRLLPDGRYGIFINGELSATITCPKVYKTFMEALDARIKQSKKSNKLMKA